MLSYAGPPNKEIMLVLKPQEEVRSCVSPGEGGIVGNTSPEQQHCSSTTAAAASGARDDDAPRSLCLVCGDVDTCHFYGVPGCKGCTSFFRKTIVENKTYTCPEFNECEINKRTRKLCRACRFRKCLRAGMLRERVWSRRMRQKYRMAPDQPPTNQPRPQPEEIKLGLEPQEEVRSCVSPGEGGIVGNTSPEQQHCSSTTAAAASGARDDDAPRRLCLVCGDVGTVRRFGIACCRGCETFFRKTIQRNKTYTCPESNECEINKRTRTLCSACRFRKCLRAGMLRERVRLGKARGGRQKYRRAPDQPPTNHPRPQPEEIKLGLEPQEEVRSCVSPGEGGIVGNTSPEQQHCSSTTAAAASGARDDDAPRRLCLVCGDVASGCHYGVDSCEPCRMFFRNAIVENKTYTCPESNECEIYKWMRTLCRACRFRKCLRAGMLRERVWSRRMRQKYRRAPDQPPTNQPRPQPEEIKVRRCDRLSIINRDGGEDALNYAPHWFKSLEERLKLLELARKMETLQSHKYFITGKQNRFASELVCCAFRAAARELARDYTDEGAGELSGGSTEGGDRGSVGDSTGREVGELATDSTTGGIGALGSYDSTGGALDLARGTTNRRGGDGAIDSSERAARAAAAFTGEEAVREYADRVGGAVDLLHSIWVRIYAQVINNLMSLVAAGDNGSKSYAPIDWLAINAGLLYDTRLTIIVDKTFQSSVTLNPLILLYKLMVAAHKKINEMETLPDLATQNGFQTIIGSQSGTQKNSNINIPSSSDKSIPDHDTSEKNSIGEMRVDGNESNEFETKSTEDVCERERAKHIWALVHINYVLSGKTSSAVLLQRRWHEMKQWTRQLLTSKDPPLAPPPILLALAKQFPCVLTEKLPPWSDLVLDNLIYQDSELEPYRRLYAGLRLEVPQELGENLIFNDLYDRSDNEVEIINENRETITVSDSDDEETDKGTNEQTGTSVNNTEMDNNTSEFNDGHDTIKKLESIDPTKAKVYIKFENDSDDELYDYRDEPFLLYNIDINKFTNSNVTSNVNEGLDLKCRQIILESDDIDSDQKMLNTNNTKPNDHTQNSKLNSIKNSEDNNMNLRNSVSNEIETKVRPNTRDQNIAIDMNEVISDLRNNFIKVPSDVSNKVIQFKDTLQNYLTSKVDAVDDENISDYLVEFRRGYESCSDSDESSSDDEGERPDPLLVDEKLKLSRVVLTPIEDLPDWRKHSSNNIINCRKFSVKNFSKKVHITSKQLKNFRPYVPKKSTNGIWIRRNQELYQVPKDIRRKINILSKRLNFTRTNFSQEFWSERNLELLEMCRPFSIQLKTNPRVIKKIELADIDEVRRINRTILTAQVAPIPVEANRVFRKGDLPKASDTAYSVETQDLDYISQQEELERDLRQISKMLLTRLYNTKNETPNKRNVEKNVTTQPNPTTKQKTLDSLEERKRQKQKNLNKKNNKNKKKNLKKDQSNVNKVNAENNSHKENEASQSKDTCEVSDYSSDCNEKVIKRTSCEPVSEAAMKNPKLEIKDEPINAPGYVTELSDDGDIVMKPNAISNYINTESLNNQYKDQININVTQNTIQINGCGRNEQKIDEKNTENISLLPLALVGNMQKNVAPASPENVFYVAENSESNATKTMLDSNGRGTVIETKSTPSSMYYVVDVPDHLTGTNKTLISPLPDSPGLMPIIQSVSSLSELSHQSIYQMTPDVIDSNQTSLNKTQPLTYISQSVPNQTSPSIDLNQHSLNQIRPQNQISQNSNQVVTISTLPNQISHKQTNSATPLLEMLLKNSVKRPGNNNFRNFHPAPVRNAPMPLIQSVFSMTGPDESSLRQMDRQNIS